MSLGNFMEVAVLDHIYGKAAMSTVFKTSVGGVTSVPIWWVGLSLNDPTDDGSGLTEPTGDYKRKTVAAIDWSRAVNVVSNVSVLVFSTASSTWGTVQYAALLGHSTGIAASDFLASGSLGTVRTVESGDSVQFNPGTLTLTLS